MSTRAALVLGTLSLALSTGCNLRNMDYTTAAGKAAVLRATANALTTQDCNGAIRLIEPVYNSAYTDNEVRMLRAQAHACAAGLDDFFELALNLTGANLVGSAFYMAMTQYFPSTLGTDNNFESGMFAIDALQAVTYPGRPINPLFVVNANSYNPGTLVPGDRKIDANFYLMFAAMTQIGNAQNRYGAPNATYNKTQDLPWTRSDLMDTDGCAYAGAQLNMVDAINQAATVAGGNLGAQLTLMGSQLEALLNAACDLGCMGLNLDLSAAGDAACAFAAGTCAECSTYLRTRTGCVSDLLASCGAAGIVRFVNQDPAFGWP